jgi:DNA-directed RNA polymerase subunit RPC12/RpoP
MQEQEASESDVETGVSLAWRCERCGRMHLPDEPAPRPARCDDCGGEHLVAAGPPDGGDFAFQAMHSPVGIYLGPALRR